MDSNIIFDEVCILENIRFVKDIINLMTPDTVFGPYLLEMLNQGQAETRAFVAWAAKKLQPKRYLEIGVRVGWSLGMVAASNPECELYCFDIWEENYAGSQNPGPEFVTKEMKKIGYSKLINFYNGNSHTMIPEFFITNPGLYFDLILVDGDHTDEGAFDDLKNVMPHVRVGGIVLFDDILLNPNHGGHLDKVWNDIKLLFTNFEYHSYMKNEPGVGIAIRVK